MIERFITFTRLAASLAAAPRRAGAGKVVVYKNSNRTSLFYALAQNGRIVATPDLPHADNNKKGFAPDRVMVMHSDDADEWVQHHPRVTVDRWTYYAKVLTLAEYALELEMHFAEAAALLGVLKKYEEWVKDNLK